MFNYNQEYPVPKGLMAAVLLNVGGALEKKSLGELGVTSMSFFLSTEEAETFTAIDKQNRSLLIKVPKKEARKIFSQQ